MAAWKYKDRGRLYPRELKKFQAASYRARTGKAPSFGFEETLEGFDRFMSHMGPIPEEILEPHLGRKDHSKGYEEGNMIWQEAFDNYSENGKRSFWKVGKSNLGRSMSDQRKAKISASMKGKPKSAEHRSKLRDAAIRQHGGY